MPHAHRRTLGTDPSDRRRKDERPDSSEVQRIRREVQRDSKAAERHGGSVDPIASRVDALTSITAAPPLVDGQAERRRVEINRRTAVEAEQRRRGSLAKPCREHGAAVGEWCWPGAAERGTRGRRTSRLPALRHGGPPKPDPLPGGAAVCARVE